MLVKATEEYERRGLQDLELGRIPKKGEEWEVTEKRYEVLAKANIYNAVFVEKVKKKKVKEEETTEQVR